MQIEEMAELAKSALCGYYVPGKSYPGNLPASIQPWYVYCTDSGHNILCCLKEFYKDDGELINYLIPVPVKTVLRSHEIKRDLVIVDLPYSEDVGLITPEGDDEY